MIKYIELEGKVPKHSFDTFSTTHEHYQDAGIILNNKMVIVDFDYGTDVAQQILKEHPTLAVQTGRGMHLYYRRPKGLILKSWTGKLTIAGLPLDFKTGTKSLGVIKQNGKLRKMSNEHYLNNLDGLPDLPFLLYPSKLKNSLYQLTDGQGRNSSLFTHLLTAKEMYPDADLTTDELAEFINQHVFTDKLSKAELEALVESVKTRQTNSTTNKWLNPKDIVMTSEVLAEKLDIKYYQQKLYFKQGDHYLNDNNKLLREIDQHIQLKPSQHNDLLKLFPIKAEYIEEADFPIKLQGGYILDDGEVLKVDIGFTPYYLNIRYEEQAYDEKVDKFLDFLSLHRKDLRLVMEEMLGHILMTARFPHKVFFLQGSSGANGKSTFLKMVGELVGDLASQLTLNDFNDATSVAFLDGKLVNIGDDIDASYLEQSKNFKTLASGDPIMVRPIYSLPFKLKNRATLIFTCNEMPTFKDKSGGIARRVVVIPCENTVQERDHDIDAHLSSDQAKSYLLRLALEGIARIRENGGQLTESLTIQAKTKEYFSETDNVVSFMEENTIEDKTVLTVFRQYVAYCEFNGFKAVGKTEFGRRLKTMGYESKQLWKDGKNQRYYKKI